MPCDDQEAQLRIKISSKGKLLTYDYVKYTCGAPIGAGRDLKQFVCGKLAEDLLNTDTDTLFDELKIDSEEERFLVLVELEALVSVIGSYTGIETECTERYQIEAIVQHNGYTEIIQNTAVLPTAPKIPLPCSLGDESK